MSQSDFEIVKKALDVLSNSLGTEHRIQPLDSRVSVSSVVISGTEHYGNEALKALSRIEANTLPELPDGWKIILLDKAQNEWFCTLQKSFSHDEAYGVGPTPRATVQAAIKTTPTEPKNG